MKLKLGRVADVQLGYQHREKVSHVEHGSHRLIQGKDLVRTELLCGGLDRPAGWQVSMDNLDRVTPKGDAKRYAVQPGDLLFVSRGTTNIAVPLNEQTVQPVPERWDDLIPAYTFYILRPTRTACWPNIWRGSLISRRLRPS